MATTAAASTVARITKIEKELNALKMELNKIEKKSNIKKPKKIEDCESIEQLKKFSVTELKEWLKKKKINVKKVSEKHKEDFVKIVWKNISEEYSDDSGSEESEDGWEYY